MQEHSLFQHYFRKWLEYCHSQQAQSSLTPWTIARQVRWQWYYVFIKKMRERTLKEEKWRIKKWSSVMSSEQATHQNRIEKVEQGDIYDHITWCKIRYLFVEFRTWRWHQWCCSFSNSLVESAKAFEQHISFKSRRNKLVEVYTSASVLKHILYSRRRACSLSYKLSLPSIHLSFSSTHPTSS